MPLGIVLVLWFNGPEIKVLVVVNETDSIVIKEPLLAAICRELGQSACAVANTALGVGRR